MAKGRLPITLLQGQKAAATTTYIDALPINVSGVVMPIMGADGFMQEQPGLTLYGTAVSLDRGAVWNDQFQMLFRVSGESLISVSETGAVTVLGTSENVI